MIEGEAVLTTDEQRVVMEPGHLYLIPPGLRFDYSCRDRFTKLYFHVNILRPDGYDLMQGFGRIGVASVEPARIANLAARYGSNRLADLVQVKTELYRLMDQILTEYDFASDAMRTYSPWIQDTISYIQANLSARLSVEQLARRLFVSRSFLTERFRRETGVTIGRYLDDQLMAAAQWQLLRTGRSIGEISESLGYCSSILPGDSSSCAANRRCNTAKKSAPGITFCDLRRDVVQKSSRCSRAASVRAGWV